VNAISEHVGKVETTHIVFAATDNESDRSLVDAATAASERAQPLYSPKMTKKFSSSSVEYKNSSSRTLLMMSFTAAADPCTACNGQFVQAFIELGLTHATTSSRPNIDN
jgi:hypothetical protein